MSKRTDTKQMDKNTARTFKKKHAPFNGVSFLLSLFIKLSNEEQKELLANYAETKNISIRDKIFNANTRLVIKLAKKWAKRRPDMFDDYVQKGSIGLLKAIDKFDPLKTTGTFSSYAYWWIEAQIRDENHKSRNIAIPQHLYVLLSRFLKLRKKMSDDTGQEPSFQEVMEVLPTKKRLTQKHITYLWNAWKATTMSISNVTPSADEDSFEPVDKHDLLSDIFKHEDMQELTKRLSRLDERSKTIIEMRLNKATLKEVAEKVNLTPERVRQLQKDAEAVLKR